MKLTWQRRHAIKEVIKSLVIYFLLGISIISIVLVFLGMKGLVYLPEFFGQPEKVEVRQIIEEVIIEKEIVREINWYQFYATGYSPKDPSQGTIDIMASGKEVYQGTIAVDPEIIPLGTKVEIKGLPNGWNGIYTAEDTGEAIKDLRIDVFRESKLEALQINCSVWVRIING